MSSEVSRVSGVSGIGRSAALSDNAARLEASGLAKRFGGFRALDGLSFRLERGEILGLMGPNGSGKTTTINVVSGVYSADGGEVCLDGKPVTALAPHRRVRLGLNRTFQVPRPLRGLTVHQNVEVAAVYSGAGTDVVAQCLEWAELAHLAGRRASTLNNSQQKRLDLARALATRPRVLLIDEMGAGLNPAELETMAHKLCALAEQGVALVVVEHVLGFLQMVSSRVIVMNAGRAIFEGTVAAAAEDPEVVRVFLGERHH